jgi:hypothetical protein
MKPLNLDNRPCSPISSNCVIWQGPDIPCIKLCTGDTISDVVFKLATELCTIMDQLNVSNYDLTCLGITACPPEDFQALIQLLITKICELSGITVTERSTSTCPDCVVSVAPCFIENGQTTMQLVDYVQMIGNRVCSILAEIQSINDQITVINSTLVDLQFQIDNIPTYTLPSFEVDCILAGSNPLDVIVQTLMNDNTLGYCALLGATGTPADINAAVLSQCITDIDQPLAALPAVNTFSAYYSGSWVNAVSLGAAPSVSNAINNIWIAVCDIYTYLSNYTQLITVVDAGDGISVTSATVGTTTTYTVSTLGVFLAIQSPVPNIDKLAPNWGSGRLCDGDLIIMSNEVYDDDSAYNPVTGIWTCPTTGLYRLDFFISLTAPSPDGWYNATPGMIIAGLATSTGCDYYTINNFTPTVISKHASISGSVTTTISAGNTVCLKIANLTDIDYTSTSGDSVKMAIQRIR